MPLIRALDAEFGASYISNNSLATGSNPGLRLSSAATEGTVVKFDRAGVVGSPTIPLIQIDITSTASAPALQLIGQSFVSATTILFTTGATAGVGGLRVLYPDGVTLGWIPILPSGSLTGAAR